MRARVGHPQPAAGDGVLALPTLLHRGPGTVGRARSRHVLFYTVRPEFLDMDDDEGEYDAMDDENEPPLRNETDQAIEAG